jgi:peptidoglycan/xylan/chitin deacetylase (PgdA/CDA1 family)
MTVPILVYHYFGESRRAQTGIKEEDVAFITPVSLFRDHLAWLTAHGFQAVSFEMILQARRGERQLPDRPVVITIDDGHRSVADLAAKVLQEFRFPAELFVIPQWVGNPGFLHWQELRELGTVDIAIQSHGLSHRLLNRLSETGIEQELAESKRQIEDHVGLPVTALAVPMGGYPASIRKLALATGYRIVCTSYYGLADPAADLYRLPRIMMRDPYDSIEKLSALVSGKLSATLPLYMRNGIKSLKNRLIGISSLGK